MVATRRAGSRPFSACTCQCLTGSRVTLFLSGGCASRCTRSLVYDFTRTYADERSASSQPRGDLTGDFNVCIRKQLAEKAVLP